MMEALAFARPSDTEIASIASWRGVTEEIVAGVVRYVFDRIRPGQFLMAVLSNNLISATAYGDTVNVTRLDKLVRLLVNEEWVPGACWGSPERVREWLDRQ